MASLMIRGRGGRGGRPLWLLARPGLLLPHRRYATTTDDHVEHVFVRNKSSGSLIVSLYNVVGRPASTPLLVHLPSKPQPHIDATEDFALDLAATPAQYMDVADPAVLAPPPAFLLQTGMPIATVRYRWGPASAAGRARVPPTTQIWPTALHDVAAGYDWIRAHLAPPRVKVATRETRTRDREGREGREGHVWDEPFSWRYPRRDLWVYGARLGATLAAGLALTETHARDTVAVRGVAAYNGVYNWTAGVRMDGGWPVVDEDAFRAALPGTPALPSLFDTPDDLFDAFASPCLFFRTPGHVAAPVSFGVRGDDDDARDTELLSLGLSAKSYLAFPPAHSSLVVPQTLLLHDTDPTRRAFVVRKRLLPEAVHGRNSHAMQASELAALMRRAIDRYELRRDKTAETAETAETTEQTEPTEETEPTESAAHAIVQTESAEAQKRVGVLGVDADDADADGELGPHGQAALLAWLAEHTQRKED